jgi:hypothetical protein
MIQELEFEIGDLVEMIPVSTGRKVERQNRIGVIIDIESCLSHDELSSYTRYTVLVGDKTYRKVGYRLKKIN